MSVFDFDKTNEKGQSYGDIVLCEHHTIRITMVHKKTGPGISIDHIKDGVPFTGLTMPLAAVPRLMVGLLKAGAVMTPQPKGVNIPDPQTN